MWPVINSSALIGWNILSSLNAELSTNERIQIITGHMVYNPAYNLILQLKATYVLLEIKTGMREDNPLVSQA